MNDELYRLARKIVIDRQECSVLFLQRKLKIGFYRATGLFKRLDEEGVIK